MATNDKSELARLHLILEANSSYRYVPPRPFRALTKQIFETAIRASVAAFHLWYDTSDNEQLKAELTELLGGYEFATLRTESDCEKKPVLFSVPSLQSYVWTRYEFLNCLFCGKTRDEAGGYVICPGCDWSVWCKVCAKQDLQLIHHTPMICKSMQKLCEDFAKQLVPSIKDFCGYCHKMTPIEARVMRRCARCHVPSYCSKPCQVLHWHKQHKHDCTRLKSMVLDTTKLSAESYSLPVAPANPPAPATNSEKAPQSLTPVRLRVDTQTTS